MVLNILGGAGKRKTASNPYVEEDPEYPTAHDGQMFQEAYQSGIQIGVMTQEGLDVRAS